ncbi:MAG: diguanylate cyclase, partial [Hyphomicrobiales bacterium]|nr:diguanylate cyclase [Hyphomicrobiales bacterium]
RRVGEVLGKVVEAPSRVARIGGDEFAVLMPAKDERDGEIIVAAITELVVLNNQYYSGFPLSLAIGAATSRTGERLEAAVRRADAAMYAEKRAYYSDETRSRREQPARD